MARHNFLDPINTGTGWVEEASTGDGLYTEGSTERIRVAKSTGNVTIANAATVSGALTVTGTFTSPASSVALSSTATLKVQKTTLTAVQIKALATTAITVAAAESGKYLQFLGAALKLVAGSETLAEPSAPDDLEIKLKDSSGDTVSTTADAGVIIVGTVNAFASMVPIEVEGAVLANRVNVPLVIFNTGSNYTGNASNDAALEVTVTYVAHDVS
jgi:hypothetical protein